MLFALLHGFVALILGVLAALSVAADEKDLEIALLRQQLRILERKARSKLRLSRPEKLMLVALGDRLRGVSPHFHSSLGRCALLVKPDTLLKWHRELVQRIWTFQRPDVGGRPRMEAELEALIVRLARENPRLGFDKIQGDLLKLADNSFFASELS